MLVKQTHSVQIKELLKIADRTIHLERDAFLYREGMEAAELFVVLSGRVQIGKITMEGQELSLRICGENDICGELTLFTESAKYLLSARVLEAAEIAVVNKNRLEQRMFEDPALALEVMKWMSDHSRRTQTKFRDLVLNGKKGALYSTLIRMTNSFGVEKEDGILIDLHLTNQELANFCASSRESVNRMLNSLKREHVLSINKGHITIHDLPYLKNEIGCENCPAIYCSIE
ncbi:Crp/Fnr family transcriptional regulator [Bacillus sp. CECT 9360]|uniref:Crp/Fnr family transcriptional regulator n=1 Tax=Bacillus sp. CECT 9360 TaxID=2845821 RepID=UPI001E566BB3|nr:Crp/Fnr family transcriptional regulator [Bacillus sp. CECT 9360]CAH0344454.1 Anaerobic regulatory protein [Bacillus sp. CECT 9360]